MHRVGRIFCRKASNPIHGCKGLCPRRIRWRFGSFAGIAVFLFFGAACTEIIHVDLGTMDSILVVDAKLTTDTASHVVKLNRSCDYYDPEVDKTTISGALVYVQREDGSRIDYVEDDTMPGWYRTAPDVYGKIGENYRLHIEVDANGDGQTELYEAESRMPDIPPIDSVSPLYGMGLPPFYGANPSRLGWNIRIYAQDPPTKENYGFSFALNGRMYFDTITDIFCFPDIFTSGLYMQGLTIYFFADEPSDSTRVPALKEGDSVTMILYSFTDAYNQYISDVNEAVSTEFPVYSAVPSNVRGNISNGAFGCFAVYSISRGSCIIPAKPDSGGAIFSGTDAG